MKFVKHNNIDNYDKYTNNDYINTRFKSGEVYIAEIESGDNTVFIRNGNGDGYRFKLIEENTYSVSNMVKNTICHMTLKQIEQKNISEYDIRNEELSHYRTHFKTIQEIRKKKIEKFFSNI